MLPVRYSSTYILPGLFTVICPYTVRFSEVENPTVRFGAVLRKRKSYGTVRCGFQIIVNPAVRCGAVIYPTVRFGAALKNRKSCGAVRCGFEK